MPLFRKFLSPIGGHGDGNALIAADRREFLEIKIAGNPHEIGLTLRLQRHPKSERRLATIP